MAHDLRLALRTLIQQKALTLAALATLSLGIGANVAIFSIAYGVLLRPLPYPDHRRLVQLSERVPGGTPALPGDTWISNLSIHAWETGKTSLGAVTHFSGNTATVGTETPRRVQRGIVGPRFFDVLAVRPLRGRFFYEDDAAAGAAPVVVISGEWWRDELGGDEQAIGRTIAIDERLHQIIGVAPSGLTLPSPDARLWTPARLAPITAPDGTATRVEVTHAIARLAPGATPEQAAAEGTALARTVARPLAAEMLFGKGGAVEMQVRTLAAQMTARVRPALLVLAGAVGLLLLTACANVANLFLSRGVSRERELAVRVALGASRLRLVRAVITESVVLSLAGGALGIGVAYGLVQAMRLTAPANFPRLDAVQMDARALAFALVVSVVAGLLAGVVPAIRGARPDLLPSLREGVGASSGRRVNALRRTLLGAEAAMAALLLIGAALLGRSFLHLMQVDPGYDATPVLTARVYLPGASRAQAQSDTFIADVLPRVRAIPGVQAAGASNMAPFGQSTYVAGFTMPLPGRERITARALAYVVTPGYAEALGLRLVRGRLLDDRDLASGSQSMVVNEQFVRTFLQGIEPVGLQLPISVVTDKVDAAAIVGVVADVRKDGLEAQPQPEVYVGTAHGASIRREINLVLKVAGDPHAYAAALRQVIAERRPEAAVDGVAPLSAQVADSVAQPRFTAAVLLAFAVLALVLAAVGMYGVLSYTVARRRREIGVRAALGASRRALVAMVVREAFVVAACGLAGGVAAAAALARVMQSLLIGVQPLDAPSFLIAAATVLAVSLVTCVVPARAAAATDPAIALRAE